MFCSRNMSRWPKLVYRQRYCGRVGGIGGAVSIVIGSGQRKRISVLGRGQASGIVLGGAAAGGQQQKASGNSHEQEKCQKSRSAFSAAGCSNYRDAGKGQEYSVERTWEMEHFGDDRYWAQGCNGQRGRLCRAAARYRHGGWVKRAIGFGLNNRSNRKTGDRDSS